MSDEKKSILLDKFNSADDFLIQTINEHFRLLTLSSFSIVIANFSFQKYPKSYEYTVISSILFLCTFLAQFIKKMFKGTDSKNLISMFSLFTNLYGFYFFMGIIYDYLIQIEMLRTTLLCLFNLPIVITFTYIWINFLKSEFDGFLNRDYSIKDRIYFLLLLLLSLEYGLFTNVYITYNFWLVSFPILTNILIEFETKINSFMFILSSLIYIATFFLFFRLKNKIKKLEPNE